MLQSHRPELFLAAVVLWGGCHIPQEATDSKGTLSSLLMQAAQAAVGSLASLFRSINLSSTPLAAWERQWEYSLLCWEKKLPPYQFFQCTRQMPSVSAILLCLLSIGKYWWVPPEHAIEWITAICQWQSTLCSVWHWFICFQKKLLKTFLWTFFHYIPTFWDLRKAILDEVSEFIADVFLCFLDWWENNSFVYLLLS